MTRNNALFVSLLLVLVSLAVSIWAYPRLPDHIPTHWDLSGNVNGYSSRFWGVALSPLMMLAIGVLMIVLPAISPKGFRLDQSLNAFNTSMLAIIAVLLVVHILVVRAGLGLGPPPNNLLVLSIGVLTIVVGNLLGKFRKNFSLVFGRHGPSQAKRFGCERTDSPQDYSHSAGSS